MVLVRIKPISKHGLKQAKACRPWASLILILFLLAIGCEAGTPASPPQLPKPTYLTFPESLALGTAMGGMCDTLDRTGNVGQLLGWECDIIDNLVEPVVDGVLNLLSQLQIPVSVEDVTEGCGITNCTRIVSGTSVKTDFTQFNFRNKDGEYVTCSGNTTETPVCMRLWYYSESGGWTRYIAGIIEQYPQVNGGSVTNNGAVDLRAMVNDIQLGVAWDHSDTEDKETQVFVDGIFDSGVVVDRGNVLLTEAAQNSSTLTTFKTTMGFENYSMTYIEAVSQWVTDLWGGRVTDTQGEAGEDFCVELPTLADTLYSDCTVAGINTPAEASLPLASDYQYSLPSTTDFSEEPTF